MNKNKYDEVINGIDTYKTIARNLKEGKACYIGWTDEEFTHYDILFTFGDVVSEGTHQRGIRSYYLFIGIVGWNVYAFNVDSMKDVGYVAEKLFNNRVDESVKKITELINGVIIEL